jgi:eukaryotic-like serine/threonine-protein kinase
MLRASRGIRLSQSKYRILHELGSGGMGTVFKGLLLGHGGFQRPIVIKQLKTPDPDHLRLFVEEARRYAVLDHENIGRIFDFERINGELCIVLEYIDGWSLVEYLERHRQIGCLPDAELSVFIVSRVCRGLQYVFEKANIVHRDVSPSNVMMTTEGTVKLIDFGIAARSGTRESYIAGKPAYMAPEMVVEMRADQRSDLFSLGAVMYEMLTGERLFQGDTTTEVLEQVVTADIPRASLHNTAVPPGVDAILGRALERTAARRYPTAGAMGEACEHFLYDKGYGPTNLSLKHYLASLFGQSLEVEGQEGARKGDPVLIPLDDEMRTVPADGAGPTRVVSPLYREPPVPSPEARRAAATVVVRPLRSKAPKPRPRGR